jgi:bifunctional non-homologous end joining protein LigD
VVIEVRALELTGQHRLRQPAYLGVRSDLSPADLEEVDDA